MKTTLSVLALLALLIPRPAAAQGFVVPFIGWNFSGDAKCLEITGCEENSKNFGVGIGAMGPLLGFESEFAYSKDFFGSAPSYTSDVFTWMNNVMLVPKIPVVRPYALAGIGLIRSNIDPKEGSNPVTSVLNTGNNSFGWDLGGGVIIGSPRVGVRGDLRYFNTFQDLELVGVELTNNQKLNFGRASVGLYIGF